MERFRGKIWFPAVLTAVALGLMALLMHPVYDGSSDVYMCALVNGALGQSDYHILYQNAVLGKIYSLLYARFGARFCWYGMFQTALLFVSFTAVISVFVRKWSESTGVWISLLFLTFFGYECFIKMNSVKTAGIAAAAAMLLLLYGEKRTEKEAALSGVIGCLLFLAGTAVCFRASLCGILFMLPVAAAALRDGKCSGRRLLAGVAAMVLLAGAACAADRAAYRNHGDWAAYAEYNEVREKLLKTGLPDYKTNEELYGSLGIDKKTYNLYKKGLIYDPEKLNTDTLQKLLEAAKEQKRSRSWPRFMTEMLGSSSFCGFLFAFLLWLAGKKKRGYEWSAGAVTAGAWFIFSILAFSGGNWQGAQEILCMWAAVACLMLAGVEGSRADRQVYAALLACVLVVSQYTWKENWKTATDGGSATRVYRQQMLGTIAADREHLYLIMPGTLRYEGAFAMFESVPTEVLGNSCMLDSCIAASPLSVQIMEKSGVKNPLRDAVGNDSVYLIDKDIKKTLAYIRTNYDENAEAAAVGGIGEYQIYQIK